LHSWVFFRAKFHSKFLYSVEKKIVGISQYAYFKASVNAAMVQLDRVRIPLAIVFYRFLSIYRKITLTFFNPTR
jgi:hypothetical protein